MVTTVSSKRKALHGAFEDSSSEDDGSDVDTDWTAPSDEDPEKEYAVDHILAETKTPDRGKVYLILWSNYPEERSTWEPEECIIDDRILDQWKETKKRVAKGWKSEFDIDAWEKRKQSFDAAKIHRTERRVKKRKRKGLPINRPIVPNDLQLGGNEKNYYHDDEYDGEKVLLRASSQHRAREESTLRGFVVPDHDSDTQSDEEVSPFIPRKSLSTGVVVSGMPSSTDSDSRDMPKPKASVSNPSSSRRFSTIKSTDRAIDQPQIQKPSLTSATEGSAQRKQSLPRSSKLSAQIPTPRPPTSDDASVMTAKKSGKTGADLLKNWKAPLPAKRSRTRPEEKVSRLYNLSARWNAEKAGRDGAVPHADDIPLRDPARVSHSIAPLLQPSIAIANDPSSTVKDVTPTSTTGTCLPSDEPQTGTKAALSCWAWKHDAKCLGAEDCAFLHRVADVTASEELLWQFLRHYHHKHRRFKFEPSSAHRCKYWKIKQNNQFAKGCRMSAEQCRFAHWEWIRTDPGFIPLIVKAPVQASVQAFVQAPTQTSVQGLAHSPEQSPFTLPVTCFFWYTHGRCNKRDKDCNYAHEKLPIIANDPTQCLYQRDPSPVSVLNVPDVPREEWAQKLQSSEDLRESEGRPWVLTEKFGIQATITHNVNPQPSSFQAGDHQPVPSVQSTSSISVRLPAEERPVQVSVSGLSTAALSLLADGLLRQPGKTLRLDLAECCPRENLKKFVLPVSRNVYGNGDITPIDSAYATPESDGKWAAQYANHLIFHDMAAILQSTSAVVVIYPTTEDRAWSFLNRDAPFVPNCRLAIHIRSKLPTHFGSFASAIGNAPNTLEKRLEASYGLYKDAFFEWVGEKDQLKRNVFLVFGEQRQAELEMTSRYFRGIGAKVWTTGVKGAWDSFRETKSGVVVFHPDCYVYSRIPHFSSLLLGRFNIFQLGVDFDDALKDQEVDPPFLLKQLFPNGQTVMITDQLLETQPQKALKIVLHLKKKNENMPQGFEQWRLYARPNVRKFLLDLVEKHLEEYVADPYETRFRLWHNIDRLVPFEFRYKAEPPHTPATKAVLLSVPGPRMPHFHEVHERTPDEAAALMLHYFAIDAFRFSKHVRRWVIVHDRELPEFMKEERHLKLYTPEKYLEKFSISGWDAEEAYRAPPSELVGAGERA